MAFSGQHPEPEFITNQVYREIPKEQWPRTWENSVMNNVQKFLMTDDNMKPMHIEIPAQNTEFQFIRGSDTLLIVVGESWTYGETFPGIGTGAGKFNLHQQLEGCMGPRMAEVTGWDLYQFAIPGNCNLYMHMELERILNHVATLGYKQVKVVLQMTENSREFPIRWTKHAKNHKINEWLTVGKDTKIDLYDWLAMYDETFFESFHNILSNFKACPIEGVLWRNFTNPVSKKRDYNFKFIEPTMITYTAKLVNHEHTPPIIMNPSQYDDFLRNIGPKIEVPGGIVEFLDSQMNVIEKMFDYIHGNKDVINLIYHNNHPTKIGHLVWAHHIIRQAGWKDI